MAERPILFRAPMVRAILAGTKTQTRRVVKLPEGAQQVAYWAPPGGRSREGWADPGVNYWTERGNHLDACPYGQPGDRLWVRESHLLDPPIDGTWPSVGDTFAAVADIPERYRNPSYVLYRADEKLTGDWRWRPSIHMPRWASRILLEVTDVRVTRLQDISEAGARAEGAEPIRCAEFAPADRDLLDLPLLDPATPHRNGFASLWDSINGAGAWEANPWVWAVSFRRMAR